MSVSIAQSILEGARSLRRGGVQEARREAGSLLQYVIGRDRTFIIGHAEDLITAEQLANFRDCVERRARGEPLQYITGSQAFFGLDFLVTTDVLIPRPETELLVETALALIGDDAAAFFCDVGTGSGCISVALLRENKRASAVALDISAAAIRVARNNARRHSVDERITFIVSNWLAGLQSHVPIFDLVVSNPPYIDGEAFADLQREVRDHEPRLALTPGNDGLSIIQRLLPESVPFLKEGGHLLIEIGFDQAAAVEPLLDPKIWRLLDIRPDLQGIPRVVVLEKTAS